MNPAGRDGGTWPLLAFNISALTLTWGQFFDGIYKLAQFGLVVFSLVATYWMIRANKAKAHNAESHGIPHHKKHPRSIDLSSVDPTDLV